MALAGGPDRPAGAAPFLADGLRWLRSLAAFVASTGFTLFGLLLVTFFLARLSPVDPVLKVVGDRASQSTYEQVRAEMGLSGSVGEQFVNYAGRVLRGDLGTSWSTGQPVAADLARAFPATIELATTALLIGASLGVLLGLVSVLKPGGLVDNIVRLVSLIGYSVPVFWLGLLMLLLFYATLHWAVGPGRLDVVFQYSIEPRTGFALLDTWQSGLPGAFANAVAHLALPAFVLSFHCLAGICRLTRAALLGELSKEYVVMARAQGARRGRIVFSGALPNVRATIVTVVALSYAGLLEGAVLTETVFAWPGIGRYLTNALFAADLPAILGGTLAIGTCFVLINALTDALVAFLDARTRS